MQLDILPTIEPDLYPSESVHQKDIERFFGPSLLEELGPAEIERLGNLDIFFVVFTNRCGSTLLTEIMHQAGLGIPPRIEVFNSDFLVASCTENGITSFTQYFLRLVAEWSRNQKVGFKIGPQQLFWLTKTGLLSHFRSLRIVHSQRRDRISQAISFYIAGLTGQWHSQMHKNDDVGPIPYRRNDILQCLHSINHWQQLANYYADLHHIPCISVDYENTLTDPDREIKRLGNFLNAPEISNTPVNLDALEIKQQRNEDNARLLQIFRQDFFSHTNSG